jgi:hypothetical protein
MGCPNPPSSCCDRRGKGDRPARTRSAKMLERARGSAKNPYVLRVSGWGVLTGRGRFLSGKRKGERISMLNIASQGRLPVQLEVDPIPGKVLGVQPTLQQGQPQSGNTLVVDNQNSAAKTSHYCSFREQTCLPARGHYCPF